MNLGSNRETGKERKGGNELMEWPHAVITILDGREMHEAGRTLAAWKPLSILSLILIDTSSHTAF